MSGTRKIPKLKCLECGGTYGQAGEAGVFECVDCGDQVEQTDALIDLTAHREQLEEIANSAATDAHVARVILAALDGETAPSEDVNQLVDFGAER